MVAGACEDTGLAKERRRLAVLAEEVADDRDEIVFENLEAIFGPSCVDIITANSLASRILYMATRLCITQPSALPTIKSIVVKARLTCSACPNCLAPLARCCCIKMQQNPVEGQHLFDCLPCP
jgi:hypothetical protein